jgi:hypothetical protein
MDWSGVFLASGISTFGPDQFDYLIVGVVDNVLVVFILDTQDVSSSLL